MPGPWLKLRSHSPGEFSLALAWLCTGHIYVMCNEQRLALCFVDMQADVPPFRVPNLHHQDRKLIPISREQKGLASC